MESCRVKGNNIRERSKREKQKNPRKPFTFAERVVRKDADKNEDANIMITREQTEAAEG